VQDSCAVCGTLDLLEDVYDNCRICGWEHYEAANELTLREAKKMWSEGESFHPDFPHPGLDK